MQVTIAGNHAIVWYHRLYVAGDTLVLPFKLAVELQARGIAV